MYDTQWRIPLSVQFFFNVMQFSGIFGQITDWHPSLWGWRPSLWEVQDPPLVRVSVSLVRLRTVTFITFDESVFITNDAA